MSHHRACPAVGGLLLKTYWVDKYCLLEAKHIPSLLTVIGVAYPSSN